MNLYDIIVNNPELIKLTEEINTHLTEQFSDDTERKVLTLIASMGHGFNNVFSTLPNMIITSHIINGILPNSNDEGSAKLVAQSMIDFIKDFTSKIDNDKIQEMTKLLAQLSNEVQTEEGPNEDSVNSESN
jgi:hypothetical protein